MTSKTLVENFQCALHAFNTKNYNKAISIFKELLIKQPDFEFGLPHYLLGCAFEELGDFNEAKNEYEKALTWSPDDTMRLGAYAEFLYVHGNSSEALAAYIKLAQNERKNDSNANISDLIQVIYDLADKMGIDKDATMNSLNGQFEHRLTHENPDETAKEEDKK